MTKPRPLSLLRSCGWAGIPASPGVYWWFFPREDLERLRIAELCDAAALRLRHTSDGKVCLYHGMAKNLAERMEWHAAQKLTLSTLRSGFLSTFRFTLLALNDIDYSLGSEQIDCVFDRLSVSWLTTNSREEAEAIERAEFQGVFHYPLNIQGNKRIELTTYVRYLKSMRSAYKRRYVK